MWMNNIELILEFAEDFKRMCHSYHICNGCPLKGEASCRFITGLNDARLHQIKEWIESNPKEKVAIDYEKI